jgi:hypothetical protein
MKKMAAGSFKVHCLAVMDEVQAKREAVVSQNMANQSRSLSLSRKTQTTSTIFSLARVRLQAMSFPLRFRVKSGGNSGDLFCN